MGRGKRSMFFGSLPLATPFVQTKLNSGEMRSLFVGKLSIHNVLLSWSRPGFRATVGDPNANRTSTLNFTTLVSGGEKI